MSGFQGVEAHSLILAQAASYLIAAPFTSPSYNLPLFLFGIYAAERTESSDSLRNFAGFLAVSEVLDIIWLATTGGGGFVKFIVIANLFVKIPTILASMNTLRLRGDTFASSFNPGQLPSFSGGSNVWSMPGGYSGRDGYQNVDDDLESNTPPPGPPSLPAHIPQKPAPPPAQPPQAPGGYQTL